MTRFIFACIIIIIAGTLCAQTRITPATQRQTPQRVQSTTKPTESNSLIDKLNNPGTPPEPSKPNTQINQAEITYTPIPPFSPLGNSYQYSVQRLYESLPITKDTTNIPGTTALVNAELQKTLSGSITWGKNGKSWKGSNVLPIGIRKIEVRNLNSDYYFWCIYGKIQFFLHQYHFLLPNQPVIDKLTQNYFIVLHFKKDNAIAYIDYFTIGDAIVNNDTNILNHISKEATVRLAKANQEAYEAVKIKTEWTINKRTETGNFENYRRGKVTLTRNNANISFDIDKFSYEEQLLIRGYIDHQGIPIW